jgi:phosphatidylglycerophosphatase A
MIKKINIHFLTLFGIGNIKIASGTFASFFTSALYLLLIIFNVNFLIPLVVFFLIIPYSIIVINKNSKLFSEIDAKEIDEYIGQSIPLLIGYYFYPEFQNFIWEQDKWMLIKFVTVAFLAFRFFDILKPYPINLIDKIKNGFGVVMDDVLAGIYATIVLHLLFELLIK